MRNKGNGVGLIPTIVGQCNGRQIEDPIWIQMFLDGLLTKFPLIRKLSVKIELKQKESISLSLPALLQFSILACMVFESKKKNKRLYMYSILFLRLTLG